VRADRLVAALLVLQARGRVTAAELADELEVSVKTARRDLEALSMAGIPVYSQAGKGGGWQLLGGSRTDLSGLTADEASTLFLVAGPSAAATPDAKAALRKLVRALPETFRPAAEAAASAVVLDPAGWGGTSVPVPTHLAALRRAVIAGMQVRLGYADRTRAESVRTAHPLGLVEKASVWYLVADTDHGMRTFRVNRVRSVEVTEDPVVRPAEFDLAAHWETVLAEMDERRQAVRVTVRIGRRMVGGLYAQFGRDCRVLDDEVGEVVVQSRMARFGTPAPPASAAASSTDEPDTDRASVELGGHSLWSIAERLAGWGALVDVVDPPELREVLVQLGSDLVAHHGSPSASAVPRDPS